MLRLEATNHDPSHDPLLPPPPPPIRPRRGKKFLLIVSGLATTLVVLFASTSGLFCSNSSGDGTGLVPPSSKAPSGLIPNVPTWDDSIVNGSSLCGSYETENLNHKFGYILDQLFGYILDHKFGLPYNGGWTTSLYSNVTRSIGLSWLLANIMPSHKYGVREWVYEALFGVLEWMERFLERMFMGFLLLVCGVFAAILWYLLLGIVCFRFLQDYLARTEIDAKTRELSIRFAYVQEQVGAGMLQNLKDFLDGTAMVPELPIRFAYLQGLVEAGILETNGEEGASYIFLDGATFYVLN